MIQYGPLFAVMEFGVGLAGFAGVAFVVIHRGELGSVDRFRISNLLVTALGAAFLALLPVLLDSTALSLEATWRLTSGVVILCVGGGWVVAIRRTRAMSGEERASMSRWIWIFNLLHSGLSLALLAGNLVGWPFTPQVAPVFFALLSPLIQAAVNFVRLISRFL